MSEETGPAAEPTPPTGGRSPRRLTATVAAALAVTAVLLVVGIVALVVGLRGSPVSSGNPGPPQPAAAGAPSGTSRPSSPSSPSAAPGQGGTPAAGGTTGAKADATGIGDFLEASEPTSIEIPSIGVRSSHFVRLGIQPDGTISVPGTAQEVGIYDAGPTPGQLGPSVLAAHVDTPSGVPGIFHELGRVRAGDVVKVSRRDGSHLTFTVDSVAAYRKSQFPTERVYKGDFTKAEIRLVTCGGPTDSRNEYRDNVVVFGHLSSAT
ncbi:sortase domain-bontaining protein [Terracoccus sp. 273MFTsu3.1]|uniref:sortase domain-containing protein n=1 Tax=Terracoccus sp. 273MFTsu3.1 TaxID=1172188 RepID=UPI00037AEDAC|nr:sortase [Terracoccus sp. 273MFTsu3.1]